MTRPASRLLAWYDIDRRVLPWRAGPGETAEPYRVWLSEIMLQQTTVAAVADYYRKFVKRWPKVEALAAAPLDEVLAAWAGLGYYARARNLHQAAKLVAAAGGHFPKTVEGLRQLPGIGAYTAGAIAAIAYDAREAAMDANAERVIARLFAVEAPLPGAKAKLAELCRSLLPPKRSGDFVQALMDLGATLCTVKHPACGRCPWSADCQARKREIQETLPLKAPKAARPLRRGAAFVAYDKTGAVLLLKRPEKGLLGGMLQPPLGPWGEDFPSRDEALAQAPFKAAWKKCPGIVRHTFTHFELEVEVWVAQLSNKQKLSWPANAGHPGDAGRMGGVDTPPLCAKGGHDGSGKWVLPEKLGSVALPTVMRKILAQALPDEGPLFQRSATGKV
jgi:A/G-specific adenine glycosylase